MNKLITIGTAFILMLCMYALETYADLELAKKEYRRGVELAATGDFTN